MLQAYLSGVPAFFAYFVGGLVFVALFSAIYWKITAHDEVKLIRAGNAAAVVGHLGALFGFAIPLSKAIAQSGNLLDFAIWAAIALVVQVTAYWVSRLGMPSLTSRIEAGEMAAGLWVGGIALVFGMLNSASMTY